MKTKIENVIINDVGIAEGTSNRTGRPYKMHFLYVKGQDEIIYKLVSNENLNEKAKELKGKKAELIYLIDYNGRFNLNDIKEIK